MALTYKDIVDIADNNHTYKEDLIYAHKYHVHKYASIYCDQYENNNDGIRRNLYIRGYVDNIFVPINETIGMHMRISFDLSKDYVTSNNEFIESLNQHGYELTIYATKEEPVYIFTIED